MCSPDAIEAGYLPAGVVKELGNRIVVVGAELAADEELELAADEELEYFVDFL